ncbi:hypothetical protein TNCV_3567791 [Trichonephila clavipes]|nr:hypothetical protein TNCV_3567791 [Trichonephila clavipes]
MTPKGIILLNEMAPQTTTPGCRAIQRMMLGRFQIECVRYYCQLACQCATLTGSLSNGLSDLNSRLLNRLSVVITATCISDTRRFANKEVLRAINIGRTITFVFAFCRRSQ